MPYVRTVRIYLIFHFFRNFRVELCFWQNFKQEKYPTQCYGKYFQKNIFPKRPITLSMMKREIHSPWSQRTICIIHEEIMILVFNKEQPMLIIARSAMCDWRRDSCPTKTSKLNLTQITTKSCHFRIQNKILSIINTILTILLLIVKMRNYHR